MDLSLVEKEKESECSLFCREDRTRTCGLMVPNHPIYQLIYFSLFSLSDRGRTCGLSIPNAPLYHLSYT